MKKSFNYQLPEDILFEKSVTPMILVNSRREIIRANIEFHKLFGYNPDELIGRDTSIITPTIEQFKDYHQYFEKTINNITESKLLLYKKKSGELFWVNLHGTTIEIAGEKLVLWSFNDFTEELRIRNEIEIKKKEMDIIFDKVAVGLALVVDGLIEKANHIFTEYINNKTILGKEITSILPCFYKCKDEKIKKITEFIIESNKSIFCELEIVEIDPRSHIVILNNVTDHVKEKTELTLLAEMDELTKIYNRRTFFQKAQEMAKTTPSGIVSFIIFDIDFFKKVNDTYGHSIGDDVLVELSTIVKKQLREGELFGRLGGEEFGIILPLKKDYAKKIAQRILNKIRSYKFTKFCLSLTVSMGISDNSNSFSIENMYQISDNMLYRAKNEGRNKIVVE